MLLAIDSTISKSDFWAAAWQLLIEVGPVLNLIGVLLGATALFVAYFQFSRTRRASEAALKAAQETKKQLGGISAVVTLADLASICREVISSLRSEDLNNASKSSLDLRTKMAHAREHIKITRPIPQTEWQRMIVEVAEVQQSCEVRSLNPDDNQAISTGECIQRASSVLESLTTASGKAAIVAGDM